MGKVLAFPGETTLDIPAKRVLRGAKRAGLRTAIVIGIDEDGALYFASSPADGAVVLWLLEVAKKRLWEEFDLD